MSILQLDLLSMCKIGAMRWNIVIRNHLVSIPSFAIDQADDLGLEDGPPTPIRNAMFSPADVLEDDIEPEMVEQQPLGFSDDLRTLRLGRSPRGDRADGSQSRSLLSTWCLIFHDPV